MNESSPKPEHPSRECIDNEIAEIISMLYPCEDGLRVGTTEGKFVLETGSEGGDVGNAWQYPVYWQRYE